MLLQVKVTLAFLFAVFVVAHCNSQSTPRTTTANTGNEIYSKFRPSVDRSDADVQAGLAILEAITCGKSDIADRNAYGEEANLSEFPWMALLIYNIDGLARIPGCGGSLITDRYVLTAAHCISNQRSRPVSVRLGEHNLNTTTDCIGRRCAPSLQEIDIEEAVYHKDYSPRAFVHDIGLIRLINRATFRRNVLPICLPITPQSQTVDIPRMQIAGWPRLGTGLRSNILQKTVVLVQDIDTCKQIFGLLPLTDNHFCAVGETEIDARKDYSGVPMFSLALYGKGVRYIQYGIATAGNIGAPNLQLIYMNVTLNLQWIASNLSP